MKTVQLIGYGKAAAKKASELKKDDVIIWNYGYTATVIGLIKETATQVVFSIMENNNLYERRFGKNRLVGVRSL